MIAIHEQFSRQMRNRLKTSVMGLGLVRLLQDARRFEEASTTLYSLENNFQEVEVESKMAPNPCNANPLKGVSFSVTVHEFSTVST